MRNRYPHLFEEAKCICKFVISVWLIIGWFTVHEVKMSNELSEWSKKVNTYEIGKKKKIILSMLC